MRLAGVADNCHQLPGAPGQGVQSGVGAQPQRAVRGQRHRGDGPAEGHAGMFARGESLHASGARVQFEQPAVGADPQVSIRRDQQVLDLLVAVVARQGAPAPEALAGAIVAEQSGLARADPDRAVGRLRQRDDMAVGQAGRVTRIRTNAADHAPGKIEDVDAVAIGADPDPAIVDLQQGVDIFHAQRTGVARNMPQHAKGMIAGVDALQAGPPVADPHEAGAIAKNRADDIGGQGRIDAIVMLETPDDLRGARVHHVDAAAVGGDPQRAAGIQGKSRDPG